MSFVDVLKFFKTLTAWYMPYKGIDVASNEVMSLLPQYVLRWLLVMGSSDIGRTHCRELEYPY